MKERSQVNDNITARPSVVVNKGQILELQRPESIKLCWWFRIACR